MLVHYVRLTEEGNLLKKSFERGKKERRRMVETPVELIFPNGVAKSSRTLRGRNHGNLAHVRR